MGGSKAEEREVDMLPQFRDAGYRLGGLVNYALKHDNLKPYEGDWVANMTGGQQSIIDAITKRGMGGSPLLDAAGSFNMDTLQGKYLNQGNPYLKSAMGAGMEDVNRQLATQFGGTGMTGSPAHLQYASEAYSKAAAPLYMQNYQNERGLQNQAAQLSPTLANMDLQGMTTALGAQGMLQDQQQREIDAQREKWDLQKSERYRRAAAASGAINSNAAGAYGGSPGSAGAAAGGLGGAASGAMLGSMLGPWGVVGGGVLGGAGGALANK